MKQLDAKKRQGILYLFFLIYLVILIRFIVFKYPVQRLLTIMREWDIDMLKTGVETANFKLFHSIRLFWLYTSGKIRFENLAGNVIAFIPFGYLMPQIRIKYKKFGITVLYGFLLSAFIEIFQLITRFGQFDVDDILLNTMGVALGYLCYYILYQRKMLK